MVAVERCQVLEKEINTCLQHHNHQNEKCVRCGVNIKC